jgi:hypothetical protein
MSLMKHFLLHITVIIFWTNQVIGQGVTIGTNAPPHPSAVLDLQSNTQGFALPRLTTTERNLIQSPVFGLQIYNTDSDCIETYFATGGWKPTQCGCSAFPNSVFSVSGASINSQVTFTSPQPGATSSWTFSQGTPSTATGSSVQASWSQAGTYAITLTVTDSAGCSSSHTDSITIVACIPFNHTFTNCGQTGRTGPSQTQCNNTYGPGFVTVSGGIQNWTVPHSGTYTIEVAGAGVSGGRGAKLSGQFSLSGGDVLKIVVGQSQGNGGGSGGTFVATSQNTPLIIGGGGGCSVKFKFKHKSRCQSYAGCERWEPRLWSRRKCSFAGWPGWRVACATVYRHLWRCRRWWIF